MSLLTIKIAGSLQFKTIQVIHKFNFLHKLIWITFCLLLLQKNPSEFLVEQWAKSNEQQAKSNKQQAESNEQRAKTNEQRAKSNEKRAKSNEQWAMSEKFHIPK